MIKKIFLDMDGVIADFNQQFINLTNYHPKDFEFKFGKSKFWEVITKEGKNFWSNIPLMDNAKNLLDILYIYNTNNIPIEILSAPSRDKSSIIGKKEWLKKYNINFKQNFVPAIKKQKFAKPDHLLIDDNIDNCKQWIEKGGKAILYTSYNSFIETYKLYL